MNGRLPWPTDCSAPSTPPCGPALPLPWLDAVTPRTLPCCEVPFEPVAAVAPAAAVPVAVTPVFDVDEDVCDVLLVFEVLLVLEDGEPPDMVQAADE